MLGGICCLILQLRMRISNKVAQKWIGMGFVVVAEPQTSNIDCSQQMNRGDVTKVEDEQPVHQTYATLLLNCVRPYGLS